MLRTHACMWATSCTRDGCTSAAGAAGGGKDAPGSVLGCRLCPSHPEIANIQLTRRDRKFVGGDGATQGAFQGICA